MTPLQFAFRAYMTAKEAALTTRNRAGRKRADHAWKQVETYIRKCKREYGREREAVLSRLRGMVV